MIFVLADFWEFNTKILDGN